MYRWFWKSGILFFFRGQNIHWGISRGFLRGPRPFWPLHCPEHSEGQCWGQKGRGSLEKHQEMPYYMFCPRQKKKIISRTFKIRGALVFLCPKEGEERRETRDERRETREERRETSERENKSSGDNISKPPGPKWEIRQILKRAVWYVSNSP